MKDSDGGAFALDRIDLKILEHLQANGRMTNQELADSVGLSASPCLSRVRRMEKAGVITGYQAQIALSRICRHIDVVAAVTLKAHSPEDFDVFEKMVLDMCFVTECTKVSGPIDYLLRFVCPDISAYQMLSDQLLLMGPKVSNLSSYIVLKSIKPYNGVALDGLIETTAR